MTSAELHGHALSAGLSELQAARLVDRTQEISHLYSAGLLDVDVSVLLVKSLVAGLKLEAMLELLADMNATEAPERISERYERQAIEESGPGEVDR